MANLKDDPTVAMLSRMRVLSQHFFHLMILITIFLIIPSTQSYPNGVGEVANDGCICHGAIQSTTEIKVDGLPTKYEANTSYNGKISITNEVQESSNNSTIGGFRMLVSHGELVFDNPAISQFIEDGWTHTENGNQFREWNFTWTSPMDNTSYVEFKIYGNAVNGNGNSYGDEWNSLELKVPGVQNFDELNTENSMYKFELYEKIILATVCLAIAILGYRAIK